MAHRLGNGRKAGFCEIGSSPVVQRDRSRFGFDEKALVPVTEGAELLNNIEQCTIGCGQALNSAGLGADLEAVDARDGQQVRRQYLVDRGDVAAGDDRERAIEKDGQACKDGKGGGLDADVLWALDDVRKCPVEVQKECG